VYDQNLKQNNKTLLTAISTAMVAGLVNLPDNVKSESLGLKLIKLREKTSFMLN